MTLKIPTEMLLKQVGVTIISTEKVIKNYSEARIFELTESTKSGSTHVVLDAFNEPIALLSKDTEGVWLEDEIAFNGEIEYFIDLGKEND